MTYKVVLTVLGKGMLESISDRRIQQKLSIRMHALAVEPEKQGKALSQELSGYRSVRSIGQRYRIIYRIQNNTVVVVALGIRKGGSGKDVYALAQKLLRQGLLGK